MSDQARKLFDGAKAKHLEGRMHEAERLYREALLADAGSAEILQGLGVLCLQTGRPQAAADYLRQAANSAGSAEIWNNLGVALCQLRHFAEAVEAYRQAMAAEPDSIAALTNLGSVLNLLERYEEAIGVLESAVRLKPESREANSHLGSALLALKRPGEAVVPLERAVALAPRRVEARFDLGSALTLCGRYGEAAEQFQVALALRPDFVPALCSLGEALGRLDRHEEAAGYFARALAVAPQIAAIHYNYGSALTFLGRIEEAQRAYARAVALAPDVPVYRYAAMAMKKTAADESDLKALEAMAAKADELPPREQAELHIALAKAYDGFKSYERAFEHLQRGNAIKRRLVSYDEAKEIGRMRAVAAIFARDFIASRTGRGDASEVPVFIVGMPRSGTTLVEQVLASHPQVFGADEQPILPALIAAGAAGDNFPSAVAAMDGEAWRRLGEAYGAKLRSLAPQALHITDKLPGNFLYAGLIHLALPKARIVHVRRDALDTCFSCFSRLFDGEVNYTYELAELGRYYRAYDALMAHWRQVLPQEAMLELRYEELVEDFEPQAKRLLAYCSLEWDERCRKFHKTRRSVRTASAAQVRQPLYKSAVGRARPYREWLGPLLAELEAGQRTSPPAP
jgi:tetratricopeptide (TPR) repeat protein